MTSPDRWADIDGIVAALADTRRDDAAEVVPLDQIPPDVADRIVRQVLDKREALPATKFSSKI